MPVRRLLEILDIARHLPVDLKGKWFTDMEKRAARFWSATRVREDLPEPMLRSALERVFGVGAPPSNARGWGGTIAT